MDYYDEYLGSTPNGGVRSRIYYMDFGGKPVPKEQAKRCYIVEYDAEGNVVCEINGLCN